MEPGRELDREIAEKVMGWKHVADAEAWAIGWNGSSIKDASPQRPTRMYKDFCPSTDIAAAWTVWEKIGFGPVIHGNLVFSDSRAFEDYVEVEAKSVPHAICLAALAAIKSP